ncbi:acyltransferase [Bacteroides congonensis]|uniref:acyltransferase n=1 Tax=Bacteroides congonensis TaxID=1871006 RepID=UPI0009327CE0|nr:acyltransferase [Bacteroides congonensis]
MNFINKINALYWRVFKTPEAYAKHLGVKVGKNTFISTFHWTSEPYLIEIGDYVRIAKDVRFFTHGGIWSQRKKNPGKVLEYFGKIKIGNYSYIGENCLIMPGVTIGNDVIIGAGSVVTKSIPDGVMVAGNPIRIIGKTNTFVERVDSKRVINPEVFYNLKGNDRRKYIENLPATSFVRKKELTAE